MLSAQQNLWSSVNENIANEQFFGTINKPKSYKLFQLNVFVMMSELEKAPSEKIVSSSHSSFILSIPNAEGLLERYRVVNAPVMDPALSKKYSGINSFAGTGIDHPNSVIRFSMGAARFQAMILSTDRPTIYIDLADERRNLYLVVSRNELVDYKNEFKCLTDASNSLQQINREGENLNTTDGKLRSFRLALAATGEFSQYWLNGSETTDAERKAKVLAAMNAAMTRTNGIYERDFAIRMVLIPNNDLIIYLDAATDPWSSNLNGTTQVTIDNVIGDANYDIGHLVHRAGNNGNAGCIGCVCKTGQKGSGFTSYSNLGNFDWFIVDYLTHEMGHQFGGNHTHTHAGSEGTIAQVEPGSGSTIMGYAGITGVNTDVQPHSDDYFHAVNIQQITNYVINGTGNSCAIVTNTNNTAPTASAGIDYTIPHSTPFVLTGTGNDADAGDVLSYCWEQNDVRASGFSTIPSATATAGPQFRSFLPTASLSRIIPQQPTILSGANGQKWEVLPSVNRTLNFRFTVRDNRLNGGATQSDNMVVNITNASGPFLVTAPNVTGISWNSGSTQTITWSVANTTAAPVSCANVAIDLSTDGGLTFPITIIASTPNDGSENIIVPGSPTTLARIRVRAVGNIFFDINNANVTIVASVPEFDFNSPAPAIVTCGTATTATTTVSVNSVLGYNQQVTLSATAGVPAGTTVSFSSNPVTPGNNVDITLNNIHTLIPGNYDVTIQGVSGAITKSRVIRFTVQPGAGPVVTTNPATQTVCAGTNVVFTSAANGALSQQWQLSTDAGATWNNINGQTGTSYTINGVAIAQNNHRFRCVYTGQCNTSNTADATLTVQSAPSLSAQPANVSICAGSNANFAVTAAGSSITYQWQVSIDGGNNFTNINNATASTYTVNGAGTAQNNYRYRSIISGACIPAATSMAAILTITAPAVVNTSPADATLCGSGNVTFSVAATGTGISYQWQLSTDGGNSFNDISGAVNANMIVSVPNTSSTNYRYRAILRNGVCTDVTTTAARLTVNTLPFVTLNASPYSKLFPGLQTTLTATVTPSTGAILIWLKNGTAIANTGNTLTINSDQLGEYKVTASNAANCNGESNLLSITDSATNKIFFYPNPNNGQFRVRYFNPSNTTSQNYIRVFDAKGNKVFEKLYSVSRPYEQMWVDLRARGTGIYFVELTDTKGKRLATSKVVIN